MLTSPTLPTQAQPYEHQVAGHGGILKACDGIILKPAVPNEIDFYTNLLTTTPSLAKFVPKPSGIKGRIPESEFKSREKPIKNVYLMLEEIPFSFRRPCILDLKMGIRHYGKGASEQKQIRAMNKSRESTSLSLGFRVSGIKVFHTNTETFFEARKEFSKQFNQTNIADVFRVFFCSGERVRTEVAQLFIEPVGELIQVIEGLGGYRFYSSSLLLTFEGCHLQEGVLPQIRLCLIDFAKTYVEQCEGPDEDLLLGLRNVRKCLEELVLHADSSNKEQIAALENAMHEIAKGTQMPPIRLGSDPATISDEPTNPTGKHQRIPQ